MTSINEAGSAGMSIMASAGKSRSLGKEDFLRLLVTQLQNQDPLNPSDPTEFTAQLAQFSSLEQLFEANASLNNMVSARGDMERLSALSLIGREVTSKSGEFQLGNNPVSLGYRLETTAQEVALHVLNGTGRTVASIPVKQTGAGEHFIEWDGKTQYGEPVAPGDYHLVVTARIGEDEMVSASPLVRGTVTGVDLGASGSSLVSTAGVFRLMDVLRVSGG